MNDIASDKWGRPIEWRRPPALLLLQTLWLLRWGYATGKDKAYFGACMVIDESN